MTTTTDGWRRAPRRPGRETRPLTCAVCGLENGIEHKVKHFNLMMPVRVQRPDGSWSTTNRGAGTIDLCERCWRTASRRSRIRAAWTKVA